MSHLQTKKMKIEITKNTKEEKKNVKDEKNDINDEKNGVMKYVNNSDADLKIRTWKIEDSDRRWDGWVCAIYADNDIIRLKFLASKITVADKNDLEFIAPKGYILFPQ